MREVPTDELAAWLSEFVRYPSQQTALFEAEPEVLGFITECFVPLAERLGLDCRIDDMGNAIVEVGNTTSGPSVMLFAYAMTHPATAMQSPFAGEIIDTPDGPSVRGRGTCEQKGALASALAATVAAARADDLPGSVTLVVSTAGETGRHDAARAVMAALGRLPDYTVIVVGTSGKVAVGNKGRIDVEIEVRGEACHSSAPWRGIDAIAGAVEVLTRLREHPMPATEHPELGRVTLTPTSVRSWPEATHTVQDRVRLVLDRRLLPGEAPEEALEAIRSAVVDVPDVQVSVEQGPFMFPNDVADDERFMDRLMRGPELLGESAPQVSYSHGCLDAGFFTEQGSPAVMWGPGDVERWHSADESVSVADLESGARAYAGFMLRHLSAAEADGAPTRESQS